MEETKAGAAVGDQARADRPRAFGRAALVRLHGIWLRLLPLARGIVSGSAGRITWPEITSLPYSLVKLTVGTLVLIALAGLLLSWMDGTDAITMGSFKLASTNDPSLVGQSFSDHLAFHLKDVSQRTPLSADQYWGGFPLVASLPVSSPPVYQRIGSIGVAGVQFPAGDILLAIQQLIPFHRPVSVLTGTITPVEVPNPNVSPSQGPAAAPPANPTISTFRIDAYLDYDGQPRYSWTMPCALPACTPGSTDQVDTLATQLAYRVIFDRTPQHDRPEASEDLFVLLLQGLQQLRVYLASGSPDASASASQKFTNVLRRDPTSPYAAYALGRLYEEQAYYTVTGGELVLKSSDPLAAAGAAVQPAADVSISNVDVVVARSGVNVFQNLACTNASFAGVTRNSGVSGTTQCLFRQRDQAFGYLGLSIMAADRYRLAPCGSEAAKAILVESLQDAELALTDAGELHSDGDIAGMMNSGVPTIQAMRATLLEEQYRHAKPFGYDREAKRSAALRQWRDLGRIHGLDPADRALIQTHVRALEMRGPAPGLGGATACAPTGPSQ